MGLTANTRLMLSDAYRVPTPCLYLIRTAGYQILRRCKAAGPLAALAWYMAVR